MRKNHNDTDATNCGAGHEPARVVSFYGNRATLLFGGSLIHTHVRRQAGTLVAGDLVEVESGEDGYVIQRRHERSSELSRPDKHGRIRTLAANIDQLVITVAIEPAPDFTLIDQYLVLANLQSIQPVIVINKIDLAEASSGTVDAISSEYADLVEAIIPVSSFEETNLTSLKARLKSRTSVFAGQSGVGKSSLVNRICHSANAVTGILSEGDGKGRHTTTTPELYPLIDGVGDAGWIIDSPGIRELSLHRIDPAKVAVGYSEISAAAGNCRFRNCLHRREPGCAVQSAVSEGQISERRYQSYLTTLELMLEN